MSKSWGKSWRGSWNVSWGSASNTCNTAWGISWSDSWRCAWELRQQQGTRTNWDTSDPLFYDWWRKRAQDERAKLEVVQEIIEEAAPALRVETIAAVEAATSVGEIQSLDLLKYERDILRAAIAEYQAMIDQDEEEAEFLLLH